MRIVYLFAITLVLNAFLAVSVFAAESGKILDRVGDYEFHHGELPKVRIFYALPENYTADTPVLFIVPGARRNADVYRDAWLPYANKHSFALMSLECTLIDCPTEYSYNSGGVTNEKGRMQPEATWLFSVPDAAFDDFKARTGIKVPAYAIYGHSAGGSFVHMFKMFKPDAKVTRAVSANAAFFAMPNKDEKYPFGFKRLPLEKQAMLTWLQQDLTVLLGEDDVGPRTKTLSNGPKGRAQGPSVYARGLLFFHEGLKTAADFETDLAWTLDIAHGVGHSNKNMIPHALGHLGLVPEEPAP